MIKPEAINEFVEGCRTRLLEFGDIYFTLGVVNKDGDISSVFVVDLEEGEDKYEQLFKLGMMVRDSYQTDLVIHGVTGWVVMTTEEEFNLNPGYFDVPPSKHPDRKEVLLVMISHRTLGIIENRTFLIERISDGVVLEDISYGEGETTSILMEAFWEGYEELDKHISTHGRSTENGETEGK